MPRLQLPMLDLGHLTWVQGKYCQSYPLQNAVRAGDAKQQALLCSFLESIEAKAYVVRAGRDDESRIQVWKEKNRNISYQLIMKLEAMGSVLPYTCSWWRSNSFITICIS